VGETSRHKSKEKKNHCKKISTRTSKIQELINMVDKLKIYTNEMASMLQSTIIGSIFFERRHCQ
jgi:hypothetical protein